MGAVVPWLEPGVGVVATQATSNLDYGPQGLEMLAAGARAGEVIQRLTAGDDRASVRQVAVIDSSGEIAVHTGPGCQAWAGSQIGEGFACIGNLLVGRPVVEAMAKTFEETHGRLDERLWVALAAGEEAGGDRRGRQSASLVVVDTGGRFPTSAGAVDLRVDDHPEPVTELHRLLDLLRDRGRGPGGP